MSEVQELLKKQAEAFDTFKKSHEEQLAEIKRGLVDPVLKDRIDKVEKSLDQAVEAKAKLDVEIKADRKFNEELEAKLNRLGLAHNDTGKRVLEVKEFNNTLKGLAVSRGKSFAPLDEKTLDEYKAAQDHYFREGKDNLTPEEQKTMSVGSDPDGGYWVTPDVSGRIVKKAYETSPVRQYASVTTISTDALEGIEDLGEAGVGYAGEHSTSGNTDTPQIGAWKIPVFNLDTEPKVTQQLLDDSTVDVEAWLGDKVGAKFGRFENAEFITGAANKIRGFALGYPYLADAGAGVAWGSIGFVATGVDADFAAAAKGDKLYDLMGCLKAEYLPGAIWTAKRLTITAIRKFKDGQNNYLWQPSFVAGQPETIMGFPVARMEDMPTIASGSYSLGFGNLKETYQIVDRQGMRILRDPFTSKPYIKFYTTRRTGGGVVNFEAFKLMKFATA